MYPLMLEWHVCRRNQGDSNANTIFLAVLVRLILRVHHIFD